MKRILTGIKPTGDIHVGNYFGAIKPIIDLWAKHPDSEIYLFIPSMHAFTTLHDPDRLRTNILNGMKMYLAMGADPDRFMIYDQSYIAWHAQLTRVLQCLTHMGFMERMHVYKDAVAKWTATDLSVGTFCYPILMAIDIIMYDATHVPVGKDQIQHVEFARDIAQKFNKMFGETFVVPELFVRKEVQTIIGTDGRKMSKSYNNVLSFLDDENTLLKKVKKIPTSMLGIDEPKNPDECNVYGITKLIITEEEDAMLRDKYLAGWLSFKRAKDYLYEKLVAFMSPIQSKFAALDDDYVRKLLTENAEKANIIAEKKVKDVYQKIGFTL